MTHTLKDNKIAPNEAKRANLSFVENKLKNMGFSDEKVVQLKEYLFNLSRVIIKDELNKQK